MRKLDFSIYDKYLGHTLTEREIVALKMRADWCHEMMLTAARGACLATAGTFSLERQYIEAILSGTADEWLANYYKSVEEMKARDAAEEARLREIARVNGCKQGRYRG